MQTMVKAFMLGVASAALSVSAMAGVVEEAPQQERQVVVLAEVAADGEAPDGTVTPQVAKFEWVAGEPGQHDQAIKHFIRAKQVNDEEAANKGWLGVMISQTQEKVNGEVTVEDVTVTNVMKDSPAERAGIQIGDVILSVGNQPMDGKVSTLVDAISSWAPGDVVDIVVLRDGVEQTIPVELGSRAEMGQNMWIQKIGPRFIEPRFELRDNIITRSRMLKKNDVGEWEVVELGEIDGNLPPAAHGLHMLGGDHAFQLFMNDGKKTVRIRQEVEDNTVEIEQENGGDITVTRIDADGNETVDTYADAEALAAADPEASELYEKSAGKMITIDLHGNMPFSDYDFDFDWEGDPAEWQQWQEQLEERLSIAGEDYHESMKRAHEALQQAMGQMRANGEPLPHAFPHAPRMHFSGKPKHSFTVQTDGTIEVKIRQGDSELVQVFADEDDLAARNEKLFLKYLDLKELDGAEE